MSEKRQRTEQVGVRFTIDELMTVSEDAINAGFTTVPAYLRHLALNQKGTK